MKNSPSVASENATVGEGIQNTPIADNIAVERTETAAESAAEGSEIFTEVTPEMVDEGEGNEAENALNNAFHSASEFMEGISETQEEDSTDQTIRIEQEAKESTYEFNTGGEAAMEAVSQILKSELEAMGR